MEVIGWGILGLVIATFLYGVLSITVWSIVNATSPRPGPTSTCC